MPLPTAAAAAAAADPPMMDVIVVGAVRGTVEAVAWLEKRR